MPDCKKYDKILDALQQLLDEKIFQHISVSEIAQKAGIGKGSIYYYFSSKEAIFDALIERNYEKPLQTAKTLAAQTDIPPFTRMAMLFQACRSSSAAFMNQDYLLQNDQTDASNVPDHDFLYIKYMRHLISELKPDLTAIIQQAIDNGEIHFDNPDALSEIVLIVLSVEFTGILAPSSAEETENTLKGLIALLEKGADIAPNSLSYLSLL